ncbi:hypothetical protein [Demequina flava]|uniref:hypothetical protein n=1 Tax=Demequina flava TaxID=1095025 RepID=UPI000781A389|nr:hypothetical protein [Demequina flava]
MSDPLDEKSIDWLPQNGTPVEIVNAYCRAWDEANYRALLWITTAHLLESLGINSREQFADSAADYAEEAESAQRMVTDFTIDGNKATVVMVETVLDGTDYITDTLTYGLVVDPDGDWVVDSVIAN